MKQFCRTCDTGYRHVADWELCVVQSLEKALDSIRPRQNLLHGETMKATDVLKLAMKCSAMEDHVEKLLALDGVTSAGGEFSVEKIGVRVVYRAMKGEGRTGTLYVNALMLSCLEIFRSIDRCAAVHLRMNCLFEKLKAEIIR